MNIPTLPISQMVDKEGNATDVELIFRQNLITALSQGIGLEGYRIPGQTTDNINTILLATNPIDNPCTLIWDTTAQLLKAIVNIGGIPTLKTVTLT